MRRLLAGAPWCAVSLVPLAAGALPTTVIRQSAAPVQIQSCSALLAPVPPRPEFLNVRPTMPAGGQYVYAAAQSAIHSRKPVRHVIYEFNVFDAGAAKPAAVFYGLRSGTFSENVIVPPTGLGLLSPWNAFLRDEHVRSVECLVAYVRFTDGTDWTSPLAVLTK